jgi:hypothetical protein
MLFDVGHQNIPKQSNEIVSDLCGYTTFNSLLKGKRASYIYILALYYNH